MLPHLFFNFNEKLFNFKNCKHDRGLFGQNSAKTIVNFFFKVRKNDDNPTIIRVYF